MPSNPSCVEVDLVNMMGTSPHRNLQEIFKKAEAESFLSCLLRDTGIYMHIQHWQTNLGPNPGITLPTAATSSIFLLVFLAEYFFFRGSKK